MFPQFTRLVDLGAESYCAVPLRTKGGAVMGLLVVMDTKPLQQGDDLQALLEVFAPRVAAEFERRRAEQERAQALADLHNVIETIPDIVFALDTQGNVVKWNRRLGDVTGYSSGELLNKPALAFVPPEEQARTAAAIQRVFMEGYAELEGHLLTKEHHLISYHWTGALLKNSHGEPVGITGIGRDISEKKRAEEALRKSEERFALAVEGSNDILWDAHRLPGEPWYAPQTPIWWSPRVRQLLGLQESDSFETFEQWNARLHPDDKNRVFSQLAAHIEHRVPYDIEYRLRTNAGDYRWIHGRGQALWDEQGEPCRMSGSCQDITERKQAQEKRYESEAQLQAILDNSPSLIFLKDLDGRYLKVNREFETLFCATEEEIVGRTDRDIFTAEQAAVFQSNDEKVLRGGMSMLFEEVAVHGNNPHVSIVHKFPLRDKEGALYAIGGIATDITERKRVEKALYESEGRYRALIDLSPNGVFVYCSGKKVYINQAACTILGAASPEQLFEVSTFHLSHPDDYESIHISLAQILATGEPVRRVERKYQRLDATPISVEVDAGRIMWDGEPAVQVIFADITERKRAEEALRASEAFNISVLNSLSSQIVVLNSQGIIMAVNKPWLRFAEENGAPHLVENFMGINYLNVCAQAPLFANGEEAASAQAGILAVLAGTHNEFALEYPCHSPDQQRWFRMRVTPLLDSPAGVVVAHENITERKQAEEALQKSEKHFRAIFENAAVGIAFGSHTTGTGISEANPAFQSMTGYSLEELCRLGMKGLTYPDDLPVSKAFVERLSSGALTHGTIEKRYVKKDGSIMWAQTTVSSILDEQGDYEHSVAMIQDITTRKINVRISCRGASVAIISKTRCWAAKSCSLILRVVISWIIATECS